MCSIGAAHTMDYGCSVLILFEIMCPREEGSFGSCLPDRASAPYILIKILT